MSRAGPRSHKGGPPLIVLEVAWGVFRDACRGQWGDGWRGWGGGSCCKGLEGYLCPAHCRSPFFCHQQPGRDRDGVGGGI